VKHESSPLRGFAAGYLFVALLTGATLGEASGGAGNGAAKFLIGERFHEDVIAAYFQYSGPKLEAGGVGIDEDLRPGIKQSQLSPERPPPVIGQCRGQQSDVIRGLVESDLRHFGCLGDEVDRYTKRRQLTPDWSLHACRDQGKNPHLCILVKL
jgi:hypothetical protein